MKFNRTFTIRTGVAGIMLTLALIAGSLFGSLLTAQHRRPMLAAASTTPIYLAGHDSRVSDQVSLMTGFTPILKNVIPAVVNISSSRIVRNPEREEMQFLNDPFFRQFFGDQFGRQFNVPRERREQSLGSG